MTTSFQPAPVDWDFNALALFDQLPQPEREAAMGAVARTEQAWRPGGPPSSLKPLGQGFGGTLYLLNAGPTVRLLILEDDRGRSVVDVVRPDQLLQLREMNNDAIDE